jgi:hypothetical protein
VRGLHLLPECDRALQDASHFDAMLLYHGYVSRINAKHRPIGRRPENFGAARERPHEHLQAGHGFTC